MNETIADIVAEMRHDIADGTVGIWSDFGGEIARCYADRVEAAHKRETSDLRCRLKVVEDALKRIDNMCDGDMCKFFDNTHHCSACRYLNECQTGVAHAALAAIREKGDATDGML